MNIGTQGSHTPVRDKHCSCPLLNPGQFDAPKLFKASFPVLSPKLSTSSCPIPFKKVSIAFAIHVWQMPQRAVGSIDIDHQ